MHAGEVLGIISEIVRQKAAWIIQQLGYTPVNKAGDSGVGAMGFGGAATAFPVTVYGKMSYAGSIGEGADDTLSSVDVQIRLAPSATWTSVAIFAGGTARLTVAAAGVTLTVPLSLTGVGVTVGSTTLLSSNVALANGAAAAAGTLANAPVAGNPTKWIPINDNGTTRYIPAW